MRLLRNDTAAFPLYSVSRSACWHRSAGRGNAPRPITSVFTPSPVKHTPSATFSLCKVGFLLSFYILFPSKYEPSGCVESLSMVAVKPLRLWRGAAGVSEVSVPGAIELELVISPPGLFFFFLADYHKVVAPNHRSTLMRVSLANQTK